MLEPWALNEEDAIDPHGWHFTWVTVRMTDANASYAPGMHIALKLRVTGLKLQVEIFNAPDASPHDRRRCKSCGLQHAHGCGWLVVWHGAGVPPQPLHPSAIGHQMHLNLCSPSSHVCAPMSQN